MTMQMPASTPVDLAFAALAHPIRRAMVERLRRGEATVAELGRPFGLAQPTISKHLKVLEAAGLIESGQDAQRRPRRLVAGPLQEIEKWIEPFRQEWEARFANLDRFLEKETPERKERKAHAAKSKRRTKHGADKARR
jgi:DNA-binding transcriptional ArsR family regulator